MNARLTPRQRHVLRALDAAGAGGMKAVEIPAPGGGPWSTEKASAAVKRLEARGLVKPARSGGMTRATPLSRPERSWWTTFWKPTAAGRAALAEAGE